MKITLLIIIGLLFVPMFFSCVSITRTETDIFTISDVDTTYAYHVRNAPENEDRGVVFPSSKVIEYQRDLVQYDSIVERYYPDFIRVGLFESVGIFGGDADHAIGTGIFGTYPSLGDFDEHFRGAKGRTVPGGIYRFGIVEKRLRWFRDAADWTIGTHVFEAILPDARMEKGFMSFAPLYLRKRWYLSRDIPYISVAATFGLGYFPSQYINLSGSIELGSIGGLNVRAYIGLATGMNAEGSVLVRSNSDFASGSVSNTIPYFGLGISVLDFHNIVPETLKEWKDHEHSSWDIGLAQFGLLSSTTDRSAFATKNDTTGGPLFSGYFIRVANTRIALPIFDHKVYAGTSLINMSILGEREWAFSVLPIRIGYWHTLIEDDLILEPFLEMNYYPTYSFQIGTRFNLRFSESFNFSIEGAYVSGGDNNETGLFLENNYGLNTKYSQFYIALVFNIWDRIFYSDELRYNKK